MGILRIKLKVLPSYSSALLFLMLGIIVSISRFAFVNVAPQLPIQIWLFDCYNTVILAGYGVPLLFIVALAVIESANVLRLGGLSRLRGRSSILLTALLTVLFTAVVMTIAQLVVMVLSAPNILLTSWHWSKGMVAGFQDYFHTLPNTHASIGAQIILHALKQMAYLIGVGLCFEIVLLIGEDERFSIGIASIIVIVITFFLKEGGNWGPFNPATYLVPEYVRGFRQPPFSSFSYWLIVCGLLVVVLAIIISGRKRVPYA